MDAEDAVEAAAYDALNVASVTDLAKVFQHVPPNEEPPVLIIGDMTSEEIAMKGASGEQISLTLVGVVEAKERRPLRHLKRAVKDALDGHQVVRDGWQLAFRFVSSDGFLDPEEGKAYAGNFSFEVLAFPA